MINTNALDRFQVLIIINVCMCEYDIINMPFSETLLLLIDHNRKGRNNGSALVYSTAKAI